VAEWKKSGAEHVVGNTLTAPYGWIIKEPYAGPWEESDLVQPVHPVFVIPIDKATRCREYFENKEVFSRLFA